MDFIALIAGLAGLWLGTEVTIRGAVSISSRLGISEFIVGVAILSIGSDLPELAIAIDGAFKILQGGQASEVVVGSAIGSAVGQIGFVLGIAGLFGFLTLPKRIVIAHGSMLLGALALLGFLAVDGSISRAEGASLVTVYLVYLGILLADKNNFDAKPDGAPVLPVARSWLYILFGLAVVVGCAELTVSAVINVARAFDISESIIAIVVIGLGTSLPELSISLGAVIRRRSRMSVGNLIGSNIFDTLVPIGVAAAIAGVDFDLSILTWDLPFLFALSALVLILFWRKEGINNSEASIILGVYITYVLIKLANI